MDIVHGEFRRRPKSLPLVRSVDTLEELAGRGADVTGAKPVMMYVYRTEEKRSDVNLAVHLVHDAYQGRFEGALVVSADNDLTEAVRVVTQEVKRRVVVCKPNSEAKTNRLQSVASATIDLPARVLRASLLPHTVADRYGTVTKPPSW